jgi:hypothetical protein
VTTPDDAKFWEDRGIDQEIKEKRPYKRWKINPRDVSAVEAEYDAECFSGGQRAFINKVVNQGDGLLIMRHPPVMDAKQYPYVYAELRPDKPATTTVRKHWHGYGEPPADLPDWHTYDPKDMEDHIKRAKDDHREKADDDEYLGDHFGVNTEEVHKHRHQAKYIFPSSGTYKVVTEHNHTWMAQRIAKAQEAAQKAKPHTKEARERDRKLKRAQDVYESHIAKKHKGEPENQIVEALTKKHLHTQTYKDKTQNFAARIDIHPLAVERFEGAEVVYFALEGCLKADSILSAGAPVLSVPSVTLWLTPELEDPAFRLKYLHRKIVVIVPDGDWRENHRVITQSLFLQTYLKYYGIPAVVASTPGAIYEGSGHKVKGVDDFLGLGKGKLEDMEAVEKRVPYQLIRETVVEMGGRIDSIKRDIQVLSALIAHSRGGVISVPYATLARIMLLHGTHAPHPARTSKFPAAGSARSESLDKETRQVRRSIENLAAHGILTVKGKLTTEMNAWTYQMDWKKKPTFILAPEFHGEDDVTRLGDVEIPTLRRREALLADILRDTQQTPSKRAGR